MAEEATQTIESDPAEEGTAEGVEATKIMAEGRIAELEAALVRRNERIQQIDKEQPSAQQHAVELGVALAQRDARIGELEAALKEREDELQGVKAQLAQVLVLYRAPLLAAEPEIPEELVHGATVEEIEESPGPCPADGEAGARPAPSLRLPGARVLGCSPVRSAQDPSAVSPQEKILMGLSWR